MGQNVLEPGRRCITKVYQVCHTSWVVPGRGILTVGMKKAPAGKRALIERMKELDCLYAISSLFSHRSLSLGSLLREIARVIPRAWQYP